jgi:hypothetical protein
MTATSPSRGGAATLAPEDSTNFVRHIFECSDRNKDGALDEVRRGVAASDGSRDARPLGSLPGAAPSLRAGSSGSSSMRRPMPTAERGLLAGPSLQPGGPAGQRTAGAHREGGPHHLPAIESVPGPGLRRGRLASPRPQVWDTFPAQVTERGLSLDGLARLYQEGYADAASDYQLVLRAAADAEAQGVLAKVCACVCGWGWGWGVGGGGWGGLGPRAAHVTCRRGRPARAPARPTAPALDHAGLGRGRRGELRQAPEGRRGRLGA